MDQAFSRMVAASLLYVLCVLTPQLVLAQAAPDSVSPPAEEPVPAEVPVTASPAPGAPAAPEAQAPKYVAPSALELAWQELHAMQKREAELWKGQRRPSLALPATAVALGVPMSALMLPLGALVHKDMVETRSAHAAGALIFGGFVGLAALVLGSTAIARTRRRWRQSDDELKFLADRRTVLEGVIEADLRAPESPTASAAETVGVTPPVNAPPAAEAQAPKYVAPGALELSLQELHAIQKREAELWKQHQRPNIALPAVGIAVGLPMFGIMLPVGAIGLSNPYDENEARDTRRAATLVAFGTLGLAALAVGSTALVRMRRKRLKADDELNSLADRRTLLESMIEVDWRATRARTTPLLEVLHPAQKDAR